MLYNNIKKNESVVHLLQVSYRWRCVKLEQNNVFIVAWTVTEENNFLGIDRLDQHFSFIKVT